MANLILWSDDYAIGVDEVDQQHKYLFDLINEALQCDEKANLKLLLMRLYKYTREHFKAEEDLMKVIGYTQYEQHKEMHNQLIGKLNKKSEEAISDPTKRNELNGFLASWLISHIIGEDTDIGNFLRNNFPKK